jgi:hypothetical protein
LIHFVNGKLIHLWWIGSGPPAEKLRYLKVKGKI